MKNGNGVFATTEEISPVKISVGGRELYVYKASEDSVWQMIQDAFGINEQPKRAYTKHYASTQSQGFGYTEPTKTTKRNKKAEAEAVAA